MDHQKIYENLIENAKLKNRNKNEDIYYENHHILPKCLEGGNEKNNLVLLTAREHFMAHKLLTYIYSEKVKISIAFHHMAFNEKYKKYVSSRDYEYAKEVFWKFLKSDETKEHLNELSKYKMGKTYEELYGKQKAEKIKKKIKNNHARYWQGKKKDPRVIEKSAAGHRGRKQSPETKEKIRQALLGKKHTEERKRNISNAHKGKDFSANFKKKIKI